MNTLNRLLKSFTMLGLCMTAANLAHSAVALEPETVYRQVSSGVVMVVAGNNQPNSLGSGIIIDSKGLIVTNHHVVAKQPRILVKVADGSFYEGKVLVRDPQNDLVLIQIQPRTALPRLNLRSFR